MPLRIGNNLLCRPRQPSLRPYACPRLPTSSGGRCIQRQNVAQNHPLQENLHQGGARNWGQSGFFRAVRPRQLGTSPFGDLHCQTQGDSLHTQINMYIHPPNSLLTLFCKSRWVRFICCISRYNGDIPLIIRAGPHHHNGNGKCLYTRKHWV